MTVYKIVQRGSLPTQFWCGYENVQNGDKFNTCGAIYQSEVSARNALWGAIARGALKAGEVDLVQYLLEDGRVIVTGEQVAGLERMLQERQ